MSDIYNSDENFYENFQLPHVYEEFNSSDKSDRSYEWWYENGAGQGAIVLEVSQCELTKNCVNFKNKTVEISKVFYKLGS